MCTTFSFRIKIMIVCILFCGYGLLFINHDFRIIVQPHAADIANLDVSAVTSQSIINKSPYADDVVDQHNQERSAAWARMVKYQAEHGVI